MVQRHLFIPLLLCAIAFGAGAEVSRPDDVGAQPGADATPTAETGIQTETPIRNRDRKGTKSHIGVTKDSSLRVPDDQQEQSDAAKMTLEEAVTGCDAADEPTTIVSACTAVIAHAEADDDALVAAYRRRGEAEFQLGNFIDAVLDLDFALEILPGNAELLGLRGQAHARLGHFRDALSDHDSAVRADPSNPVLRYNRAIVHRELEDFRPALEDLDRALALDATYGDALLQRALVRCDLKLLISADDDWSAAIELGAYEVRDLQYDLSNAGHYDGDIDGEFDRDTRRGLRAWIRAGCT